MDKDQIHRDLGKLVEEIDGIGLGDAERQRLRRIVSDLEQHVDDPDETEIHEELADTVDEMISRFETEHPGLADMFRRVLNTLGSMGV